MTSKHCFVELDWIYTRNGNKYSSTRPLLGQTDHRPKSNWSSNRNFELFLGHSVKILATCYYYWTIFILVQSSSRIRTRFCRIIFGIVMKKWVFNSKLELKIRENSKRVLDFSSTPPSIRLSQGKLSSLLLTFESHIKSLDLANIYCSLIMREWIELILACIVSATSCIVTVFSIASMKEQP